MRASLPAVVLKIHHGSLGIARSLGRLGVEVHGVSADCSVPAARSRYWRSCRAWDVEGAPAGRTVDYLLDLGRQLGRKALLVPTNDRLTDLVAVHAAALREHFVFPEVAAELARSLSSKKEMYLLATRLGIPTAPSVFPAGRADVLAFLDTAVFPVMLKVIDGVRKRGAGSPVVIARGAAELLEQYDRLEDPAAPNLMLQEYIPGGEDSVWMFNGYFNASSDCLFGITGRKIRQNPAYTGATSLGVCLANEEVERTTRRFMKAVGYRGILDIGYRYDARVGQYKVLDVNPRIGSSFRLFVDGNGLDVVRALYRDMTGQPVPPQAASEGRKWLVENLDLESCIRYRRDGKLPALAWLASYGGVREGAWFARDDLRPFVAMAAGLGASAWRKTASWRRAAPKRMPRPGA